MILHYAIYSFKSKFKLMVITYILIDMTAYMQTVYWIVLTEVLTQNDFFVNIDNGNSNASTQAPEHNGKTHRTKI